MPGSADPQHPWVPPPQSRDVLEPEPSSSAPCTGICPKQHKFCKVPLRNRKAAGKGEFEHRSSHAVQGTGLQTGRVKKLSLSVFSRKKKQMKKSQPVQKPSGFSGSSHQIPSCISAPQKCEPAPASSCPPKNPPGRFGKKKPELLAHPDLGPNPTRRRRPLNTGAD